MTLLVKFFYCQCFIDESSYHILLLYILMLLMYWGKICNIKSQILQVLDEADRLLEDNFGEQLQTIFAALPQQRQTLLFSATLTESLKQLEQVAVNKPFFWTEESRSAFIFKLNNTIHTFFWTEESQSASIFILNNTIVIEKSFARKKEDITCMKIEAVKL